MFMLPSEKKRLTDEIDRLGTVVDEHEASVRDLKYKYFHLEKQIGDNRKSLMEMVSEIAGLKTVRRYGIKKDGTPKAKPGRKPK